MGTSAIKDIIPSPGEDVFLVVRADGQCYLFGQQENRIKMTFEVPAGGISRVTWIDSISGDFLLATPKAGVLRIYNAAMP